MNQRQKEVRRVPADANSRLTTGRRPIVSSGSTTLPADVPTDDRRCGSQPDAAPLAGPAGWPLPTRHPAGRRSPARPRHPDSVGACNGTGPPAGHRPGRPAVRRAGRDTPRPVRRDRTGVMEGTAACYRMTGPAPASASSGTSHRGPRLVTRSTALRWTTLRHHPDAGFMTRPTLNCR